MKMKKVLENQGLFLAEKERCISWTQSKTEIIS